MMFRTNYPGWCMAWSMLNLEVRLLDISSIDSVDLALCGGSESVGKYNKLLGRYNQVSTMLIEKGIEEPIQ